MKKLVTIAMFAATALSAGTSASAQPLNSDGRFQAAIRHSDLNLSTPAGMDTFRGRVKTVANQICGTPQALPYGDALAVEQCRTQLYRAADAKIAALAPATEFAGTR